MSLDKEVEEILYQLRNGEEDEDMESFTLNSSDIRLSLSDVHVITIKYDHDSGCVNVELARAVCDSSRLIKKLYAEVKRMRVIAESNTPIQPIESTK